MTDWIDLVAKEIREQFPLTPEGLRDILTRMAPSGQPLLQCIDCKNTESPAGAMARAFNHGRCLHCGGYFKVVKS